MTKMTSRAFGVFGAFCAVGLLVLRMTSRAATEPGLEAYNPTKLEWAALELQAHEGRPGGSGEPAISFLPATDGAILCFVEYPADYSSKLLKGDEFIIQQRFDSYKLGRDWPWLRLRIRERKLPR